MLRLAPERQRVTALEEFEVQESIVELPLDMGSLIMEAFCCPDDVFYTNVAVELNLGRSKLVATVRGAVLRVLVSV